MGDIADSGETDTLAQADTIADKTVEKLVTSTQYRSMVKGLFSELIQPFMEELKKVSTEVEHLKGDVFELKNEKDNLLKENVELKKRLKKMEESDTINALSIIDQEQHKYRNYIKITGAQERREDGSGKEDTNQIVIDTLKEKLNINIQETDIDQSYRVKSKGEKKGPRPLNVEFSSYRLRRKIMSERRKLKGTGIGFHDCLSIGKVELLNQVRQFVNDFEQAKSCWTWEGHMYVLFNDGKGSGDQRLRIKSHIDLNQLAFKFGYK